MSTQELLLAFFEAENRRDWVQYCQFLHPEVEWWLYGATNKIIQGIDDYLETIQRVYQDNELQFCCEHMVASRDGQRIVSYLIDSNGNRSVDIFQFKDGMIHKEYEFLLA